MEKNIENLISKKTSKIEKQYKKSNIRSNVFLRKNLCFTSRDKIGKRKNEKWKSENQKLKKPKNIKSQIQCFLKEKPIFYLQSKIEKTKK